MERIRALMPRRQVPDAKPASGNDTSKDKPQPTSLTATPHTRQPCGPKCWLKGFLEYPQHTPEDEHPHLTASNPATNEQRLEVARQLYSPIWSWQTRLIRILPGTASEPLCCDLVTVDLIATSGVGATSTGEIIEYEALSYSWGYPAFTHRVQCNGVQVPVIEGLAQALHYLRLSDRARYLWVDAFCINQFDSEEKSRQVRNMLLIYQKSTGIVAWLGVPEHNDIATLVYLRKIATSDTPVRNEENHYHDSDCAKRYAQVSADLCSFYSKPWFSRTWIRQEVFASKALTLLCGHHNWDNGIFRAIDVWQQFQPKADPESLLVVQHVPNQDTLETMRQSRIATKQWLTSRTKLVAPVRRLVDTGAWLEGLLAGVRFGVTDPRDKVYGIIGMLEEKSKLLDLEAPHSEEVQQRKTFTASVDYAKSTSVVYQEITKFLINRDQNLLPLCVFRNRTVAPDGLPGWAVNCNPASRSWYIATHLTAVSERTLQLQEEFMKGLYSQVMQVDVPLDGTLLVTGYRICTLKGFEVRTKFKRKFPFDKTMVTSPPLPDKGFFHSFITDSDMITKECAYRELEVAWLHHASDSEPSSKNYLQSRDDPEFVLQQLPQSVLVSEAADSTAFLAVVDGSPLPFVLQGVDQRTSQYIFLGPACWSLEASETVTAPGYIFTTALMKLAREGGWEKEQFRLR